MLSRRTFIAGIGAAAVASGSSPVRGADSAARNVDSPARDSDPSDVAGASAPEPAWQRTYRTGGSVARVDALVPFRDGHVLAGFLGAYPTRGLAVRVDGDGRPLWRRTFAGPPSRFSDAVVDGDGVVLVGLTNGHWRPESRPRSDPWLVRLTGEGEVAWRRTLQPTAGQGWATSLAPTSDGYLVAGTRGGGDDVHERPWVAAVDAAGDRRWRATLGPDDRTGRATAAATHGGATTARYVGGWAAPASYREARANGDAFVARLTADGREAWSETFDPQGGAVIEALVADSEGVTAVGNRLAVAGADRGWLARLGADGSRRWGRTFSPESGRRPRLYDVARVDDGYLLCGTRDSTRESVGGQRAWVVRTDARGRARWQTTYGHDGRDGGSGGYAVDALGGGAFLVGGNASTEGGEAPWLLNAGGTAPTDRAGPLSGVAVTPPPGTGPFALGAAVGAGGVAVGRRLLARD